jgi:outer membrane protein assembly factor BamB
MFQQQESRPWYQTLPGLIAVCVLLPPVGIFLLWKRRGSPIFAKAVVTVALIVLSAGYVFLFNGWRRSRENEAHYSELEQHRAQQQQQSSAVAQQPAQAVAPTANAAASPGAESAFAHAGRNYWTNYRGPNRDGRYEEVPVLTSWPAAGLTPIWKQPIGIGWASFTVADGVAFTIEQRRRQEVVAAYDLNTGRELWTQGWDAEYKDSTGDGPRATPTWDEGRLYALGATGEMRCLDAKTGRVIWAKNILSENGASNLPWAMAASPLIVDDKVIVLPGGSGGKSVVAYNKLTGVPVWKSLDDKQAYVSPMLVTLNGRRQILVVSATRAVGLVPETGALVWSYAWDTNMGINVSQPIIVGPNRFFISSGYGKGAAVVEVNGANTKTIWENINMKNKFNSSVLHQGHVYGLDEGILTCVDVNTGERKWKGGRYGYGQVIFAGGNLIVITDAGELALVRAAPDQFSELARFQAIEGQTWNYPAIASGRLLVRNANQMAAFNIAAR